MENDFVEAVNEFDVMEILRRSVSCAVVVVDSEKKVSVITSDAAQFLGDQDGKLIFAGISALPEPLPSLFEEVWKEKKTFCRDIKIENQPGKKLNVTVAPVLKKDELAGAVLCMSDLTRFNTFQEKLEIKLERIDRLASIGTLSASMAHEIKNALVAVRTFTDLLLEQNQTDELAGIVGREMTRINSIVSQMLRFSGPAKPQLVPMHLHEVLAQSIYLVQNQMEEKSIRISRNFSAQRDIVQGDDYQLKQAFLNLLLNALEATPPGGELWIDTYMTDESEKEESMLKDAAPTQLSVAIRDNGTGVSPENISRLFEPFFTTKIRGTGLGLPITRRIVHEHRGKISVQSKPGQGAEFIISIPLYRKG